MNNVLLAGIAATTIIASTAFAQEQLLKVDLHERQRVFVCTAQEPVIDVVTGLLQEESKQVDRRLNYMLTRPDGTTDCDYLKDADGNLLLVDEILNFKIEREERMNIGGAEISLAMATMDLPTGRVYFALAFQVVGDQYTSAVEPIGKMPDKP